VDSTAANPSHPPGVVGEPFRSLTHFGGFDWAMEEHQFAVVDRNGTMLLNLRFKNDAQGWSELRAKIAAYPHLAVAIETSCGPAVERLLELGVIIYPINPKAAERFRDRGSTELAEVKLCRPETYQKRLELFAKANEFTSPSLAVTARLSSPKSKAKSLLAVTLAKQLRTLQAQLDEYRDRINELFNSHPDRDCFGSLPGAGEKIAPRLLSELGNDRARFGSHEELQMYAGTAPVTRQSGKRSFAKMRHACNETLRTTLHLWADLSRPRCAWAQACYQQKKDQGMAHAAALRCLGQRWLNILWKMWQTTDALR